MTLRRSTPTRHGRTALSWLPLTVAAGVFACADLSPTATVEDPVFAPGGGGPPVKVTATDPTQAEQGTTLLVRVLGSNFEPGATAEFRLDGVPPGKVRTNSTTFVNSGELHADVTIDADADLGLYDVEVTTLGGKKGVGTELFKVTEKGGPKSLDLMPLEMTFRSSSSDALRNDQPAIYSNDVDDVRVGVLVQPDPDLYGDLLWNTDLDPAVPGFRLVEITILDRQQQATLYAGLTTARGSNGQDTASHRAFISAVLSDTQPTRFIVYWDAEPYHYELRYGTECRAAAERPLEKASVTLIAENPRVWRIESTGPALLCRRLLERKGRPQPDEAIEAFAPFQMTLRER